MSYRDKLCEWLRFEQACCCVGQPHSLVAFRVSHLVSPCTYLVDLVDLGLPNTVDASQSPARILCSCLCQSHGRTLKPGVLYSVRGACWKDDVLFLPDPAPWTSVVEICNAPVWNHGASYHMCSGA